MVRFNFLLSFLLFAVFSVQAQLVITDPVFPIQGQTITLTYDASKGNAALKGSTTPVYAHAGLITNASTSPTDWKFVQGTWATADAKMLMTKVPGTDKYTLTINTATFYGYPAGTIIKQLSFVFRNAAGTVVGRDTDGGDIYYNIYQDPNARFAMFFEPATSGLILNEGSTLPIFAAASLTGELFIIDNGVTVASLPNDKTISHTLVATGAGAHQVIFLAEFAFGGFIRDTFTYTVPGAVASVDPPAGSVIGAKELSSNSFRVMLHAPGKQNVYVLGSFNDYKVEPAYSMKRSVDGTKWWLDITGLTANQYYTYQFLVDGAIKVADPVSTLILDPSNDGSISAAVFPNMPPYPTGKTTGHVSAIKVGAPPYNWQINTVIQPAKTDLVIYECLLRDFLGDHSLASMTDTLKYLKRLGINAIELMPVSEFENNNSWGYNVSYHGALDKYYGSPERMKAFVDEAHKLGMVVILDVVYNHVFGQSPLARLYWDGGNNRPAANNPWLNPVEKHPFNVGSDFNHESQATKDYTITTLRHWLNEYKIDGFRFDLSKGFTQKATTDVGLWSAFDQSRIDIWKKYGDAIWANHPKTIVILEHFADNSEETQLVNYGFLIWGNTNNNYNEASMGFTGNDLQRVSHKSRGWTPPNLVGYMESHDEERLMYKNLQFGNTSGAYSVKNLNTALARQELVNAFFLTVPGPKMIWQFGEMGYDFSINACPNGTINNNCRVDPKPVKWDYLANANRKRLFDVVQALIHLRNTQEVFETGTYNVSELGQGQGKAFHLSSTNLNVTILGNFGVTGATFVPNFQKAGTWYDYITGATINVASASAPITLQAGEYRVYTDKKVALPLGSGLTSSINAPELQVERLRVFPNPSNGTQNPYVAFSIAESMRFRFNLLDVSGRVLEVGAEEQFAEGDQITELGFKPQLPGVYFIQMTNEKGASAMMKWVVVH
jgi:glycosidase